MSRNTFRKLIRPSSSEVRLVERIYRDESRRKPGGGLKDRPQCERCGRPVKVNSDDYTREEILCATCASEVRASEIEDYEPSSSY